MKSAGIFTILVLTLAACKNDGYPVFQYINNSEKTVSFWTGEKDSPEYTLAAFPGTLWELDSDVRGRGDILYIKPPYVIRDMKDYDPCKIVFIVDPDAPEIEITIENYLQTDVFLTEEKAYLWAAGAGEPFYCKVDASSNGTSADGPMEVTQVYVYTKKPLFKLAEKNEHGKWVNFSGSVNITCYPDPAGPENKMIVAIR
jgi:hypothetical protein